MRYQTKTAIVAALLALTVGTASAQVAPPVVVEEPGVAVGPGFGFAPPTGSIGTATGNQPDPSIAAQAGGDAAQGGGGIDPNYIRGISPPGHSSTTGTGAAGASGFSDSGQ